VVSHTLLLCNLGLAAAFLFLKFPVGNMSDSQKVTPGYSTPGPVKAQPKRLQALVLQAL
jgi:hypothetical protein